MATISGAVSNLLQQVLDRRIESLMVDPLVSPFVSELVDWSDGVRYGDLIGKDWKYYRTWSLGLAGAVEFAPMAGPDVADVGSAVGYQAYQEVDPWPGLSESVFPANPQDYLTLKKLKLNFQFPVEWMRAASLGASIGDMVEQVVDGAAKKVAMTVANTILAGEPNSGYGGVIAQFTSGASDSISKTGLAITLDDDMGTSIGRFVDGMAVDIFEEGTNTRSNSEPVFCGMIDGWGTSGTPITTGGTLKLYHVGATTTSLSATTQYDIVPRNSGRETGTSNLPSSLESFIVESGTVGNWPTISASTYPMLKSLLRTADSSVLSEAYLNKLMASWVNWRGQQDCPDTFWMTPGILVGYINSMDSSFTRERQGATVNIKGGAPADITHSLFGIQTRLKTDRMLPGGTVYGLKMRDDNFRLVRPPRLAKTGSHGMFPGWLEFMAPALYGGSSIFAPYLAQGGANGGALTSFLQAPAWAPLEVDCWSPSAIKVTGFTDQLAGV